MKKILSILFLLFVGVSVYAQKSYITLYGSAFYDTGRDHAYITGDVSKELVEELNLTVYGDNIWWTKDYIYLSLLFNKLSEKGYEIEFAMDNTHYILSKNKEGSSSSIQRVRANNYSEPHEVARYNLQGRPVKSYEKGIQIIVFSNYTTKTVIVE